MKYILLLIILSPEQFSMVTPMFGVTGQTGKLRVDHVIVQPYDNKETCETRAKMMQGDRDADGMLYPGKYLCMSVPVVSGKSLKTEFWEEK